MLDRVIIALVVVSALLHAAWNAMLRLEPDKDRSLVAATLFATLFAFAVTGVRWGLGEPPLASLVGLGFAVAAGVFEAVYFTTLAAAMQRGTLGTVYTISRGGAVLLVWPLSALLFAEAVTASSTTGSLLVLAGLVLCGLGARGARRPGDRSAVHWAIVCAVSIAGYHLGYKAALQNGVNPSACFALALGVATAINVGRLGRPARQALRGVMRLRWPRLLVMGLVCGGSFLLLMEALARGGSGFVLTLRNTSVLFAVAMAWWIGERPSWRELAGAALVAAGAAVMAG
jgi:drug/metabolite transporter (DMT)-like permease